MPVPKTLLFTPTPPGQGSVGEQFLRCFVQCFPPDSIVCYAPWSGSYAIPKFSEELSWLPMEIRNLPTECYVSKSRKPWLDAYASFINRPKHWAELQALVDEAVEFGLKHEVKVVLAVLASPSTIKMAREVADRLSADLVPLIWDPIETTMGYLQFDALSQHQVLSELKQVLLSSSRCGVASESMANEIYLKYGLDCSVLIRPVELRLLRECSLPPANEDEFIIVFSGSAYSQDEINALLMAITKMGWQIDGRQIVFRALGNNQNVSLFVAGKKARYEFLGYRPLTEVVEIVSNAHVAYLPYWIDPKYKRSVQNCFPDKLGTYLTAGTPILFHGPEDSTPTRFIERYPVGVCCHSSAPDHIESTLRQFLPGNSIFESAAQARKKAIMEEMHPEVFLDRVAHLVGAKSSDMVRYWDAD